MNDPKPSSKFDHLIEHLLGFLETKSELIKLELKEELAKVVSKLISLLVIMILVTLFLIFFAVALGHFLNYLWNSAYLGFVTLGGFFFLLWIGMMLIKRTDWYQDIINSFTNSFFETLNTNHHETGSEIQKNIG